MNKDENDIDNTAVFFICCCAVVIIRQGLFDFLRLVLSQWGAGDTREARRGQNQNSWHKLARDPWSYSIPYSTVMLDNRSGGSWPGRLPLLRYQLSIGLQMVSNCIFITCITFSFIITCCYSNSFPFLCYWTDFPSIYEFYLLSDSLPYPTEGQ